MTDKKQKDRQMGIGEINTIRQILMGERFEAFERQLGMLQDAVSEMKLEMDSTVRDMKSIIKQNDKDIKTQMLNKIVDLENRMVKHHDKTRQRSKKDKAEQTEKLSKLFIKIGKDLSD